MRYYQIILLFALVFSLSACVPSGPSVVDTNPAPVVTPSQPNTSTPLIVPAKPKPEASQPQVEPSQPAIIQPVSTSSQVVELPVDQDPGQTVDQKPDSEFLDYPVAFASQAPYGIWDELHSETCEEASMIMAVNFFKDQPLDNHLMEQALLKLTDWEEINGYKIDLTAAEVVAVLDQYFNQPARLLEDVSVSQIIAELDQGNLIIVPAAGRNLGNPYFTSPGPVYHMLVIRGYDKKTGEFITNDPGTKRGEAYRYKYSRLLNAIADWDHALAEGGMTQEEMEQGDKILIVVTP